MEKYTGIIYRAYNYSNNKIIGTYNSILEASKTFDVPYSTLNKCVRDGYDYLKVGEIKVKFKEINGQTKNYIGLL